VQAILLIGGKMGYGAYMKVTNNNPSDVRLYVHSIVCMYNGGEEGSNLNYFNGLEVVSGETQPPEGKASTLKP
jgi:hypothetical protein